MTLLVTVTVLDTDAVPQEGLPVYVFDGATYTGYNDTTDVNGEVSFTLPPGDYHFRADLNGTQFWSDIQNHCTIPGCETASIIVTIPVTVTVGSQTGTPYPDLPVYVFSGETYTGFNDISDVNGQVVFALPAEDYRFRSDYDGVQFWSDEVDHCTIPSCLEALVEIPGGTGEVDVTIDYYYDPLYRLTNADYSTGEYFWYTYDAVGNRLMQDTHEDFSVYVYDDANKLTEVDGVTYTWDVNGNLLSDGVSSYTYNWANRLTSVVQGDDEYVFEYNGLGDRLSQYWDDWEGGGDYILDIVGGLTQVLEDETASYLYGVGRIGEEQWAGGWLYHQADALGSVRQLIDSSPAVARAESYLPFGELLMGAGATTSSYGFTGEYSDSYIKLIYLRSRYYAPESGRFITKDAWTGDYSTPMSQNRWLYVYANPVTLTDPTGHDPWWCEGRPDEEQCRALWILNNGGEITSDILETIYWHDPSDVLAVLQREFNIQLPSGYQYRLVHHASGAIGADRQFGVELWFFAINYQLYPDPSVIEISTQLGCKRLDADKSPANASIIDRSVFITDFAFEYWNFDPDDVAAVMIHEGVHAWQEEVARSHVVFPGARSDVSSVPWHSDHENGIERGAVQYVLEEQLNGRLEMSWKARINTVRYGLRHRGGPDYPFSLPPGVP